METELRKFGVDCEIASDEVMVYPAVLRVPSGPVSSHNDHRVAMALSLILSVTGGVLEDAETVQKSFPDYFEVIESLGIKLRKEE